MTPNFLTECVRQTVSSLNVLDYTCAECRRGGITSRAAAVRLAPRTIATLFMAKRRFNKYAHRQYLASRKRAAEREAEGDADEPEGEEPAPLRVDVERDDSDASEPGADAGDTSDPLDAALDVTMDATLDASLDAAPDASLDTTLDAAPDA